VKRYHARRCFTWDEDGGQHLAWVVTDREVTANTGMPWVIVGMTPMEGVANLQAAQKAWAEWEIKKRLLDPRKVAKRDNDAIREGI
jgi:hypothetical protein